MPLSGDAAIKKYSTAIEFEIRNKCIIMEQLERRLKAAEQDDAEAEREEVQFQMKQAKKTIEALKVLLSDVPRDWKSLENRILCHVVLSPPIGFNVGKDRFIEDWAVIEIDASTVDLSNLVGNVIDL
ncbi:hypothetical protein QCA50_004963 [Cerrena zonata]|uniref:Uncharacterized protein n=1 Tax=Cerrena zonata TaxID=2478898 RepID=A0AAW0GK89_9APHY